MFWFCCETGGEWGEDRSAVRDESEEEKFFSSFVALPAPEELLFHCFVSSGGASWRS